MTFAKQLFFFLEKKEKNPKEKVPALFTLERYLSGW